MDKQSDIMIIYYRHQVDVLSDIQEQLKDGIAADMSLTLEIGDYRLSSFHYGPGDVSLFSQLVRMLKDHCTAKVLALELLIHTGHHNGNFQAKGEGAPCSGGTG